ncbi:hypothetical protein L195_g064556, partial [Trifolium pratense]
AGYETILAIVTETGSELDANSGYAEIYPTRIRV